MEEPLCWKECMHACLSSLWPPALFWHEPLWHLSCCSPTPARPHLRHLYLSVCALKYFRGEGVRWGAVCTRLWGRRWAPIPSLLFAEVRLEVKITALASSRVVWSLDSSRLPGFTWGKPRLSGQVSRHCFAVSLFFAGEIFLCSHQAEGPLTVSAHVG